MSPSLDSSTAEHRRLTQGLIVRPDGMVEVSFLDLACGRMISGQFRGADWQACFELAPLVDNSPATTFARLLGWRGEDLLRGTAVFFGDAVNPDVPGKVLAAAVRMWDVVLN